MEQKCYSEYHISEEAKFRALLLPIDCWFHFKRDLDARAAGWKNHMS